MKLLFPSDEGSLQLDKIGNINGETRDYGNLEDAKAGGNYEYEAACLMNLDYEMNSRDRMIQMSRDPMPVRQNSETG